MKFSKQGGLWRKGTSNFLFVYGTLCDPRANPVAGGLWKQGEGQGQASFQGRLYREAGYPGAVPSDDPADRVHGVLIRLSAPDHVFSDLDAYEGVPDLFRREQVVVTKAGGAAITAWIYLYNRSVIGLQRIPSGRFTT